MYRKLSIFVFFCLLIFTSFGTVLADSESSFQDLLAQLRSEGRIPEKSGSIIKFSEFSDELASIGNYSWFPVTEADNFVLSSKVSWESGNDHPNSAQAGCGLSSALIR